jgi:hypothetical protein
MLGASAHSRCDSPVTSFSGRYYVDTRAQPPRSSWQHPQGAPTSPQQSTNYSPPPNPPPNRAYNSGSPPYPGQYGAPQYNQTSPYPSGYGGGQPDRNFPGSQQYPTQGGYGYPGQGWPQPQQSPGQGKWLNLARDVKRLRRSGAP